MRILKVVVVIILSLAYFMLQAQEKKEYLKEAYLMANIKSFYSNGKVKCEMICFLSETKKETPPILFQLLEKGKEESVYEAWIQLDPKCSEEDGIKIKEKENGYEINFGRIQVGEEFQARLLVEGDNFSEVYDLELIGYQHKATSVQ